MRNIKLIFLFFATLLFTRIDLVAKETIAIINFDVIGSSYKESQYISMVTSEIRKLDTMNVIDKYSVSELVESKLSHGKKCFGVKCISELGLALDVNYALTGSAELTGEKLSVHLRLIDPKSQKVIESDYSEYLFEEEYIWKFMEMSVKSLFNQKVRLDDLVVFNFDRAKNAELEGPRIKPYNLSGPRFGLSHITGINNRIIKSSGPGGYGKNPTMTVIGYQYEKSYLYTGALQAVFQTNISLTGLDQQMAIPSFSFLNGFRSVKYGFEIGFGPIFRLKQVQKGYLNNSGDWLSESDNPDYDGVFSNRLDSRGSFKFQPGWVWAIGRSLKAGNMTIPINFYALPDNDGWLYGFSFGYALRK
jgi:TolB-like protein